MLEKLTCCTLCPRKCNIDRTKSKGKCKCDASLKVSLSSLHFFEEPCISGKNGSGTVFFTNCNLKCIYCQNYEISQKSNGKAISIEALADIFLAQQKNGAENINLVTPTMYVYHIIEAISIAKSKGLTLPIIYNTNGYENIETIKLLSGYIDVYLPDLKYSDNTIAKLYSDVDNYFEVATEAIKEMYFQVGLPKLNKDGIIQKGIIIRHLILPNHLDDTKKVLTWIKENMPHNIYVSVMAQYFPSYNASSFPLISRKLSEEELLDITSFINTLGLSNGYIQSLEDCEEKYVPKFTV